MRNSLSCSSGGIRRNLCIVVHSFLSCPLGGIHCNLHIAARSSLSYSPTGIRRTLRLRSSSVPLPSKMVPADARALRKGFLFLFVHWFNESCYVEGGEVCSVGKVTGGGGKGINWWLAIQELVLTVGGYL